jgi:Putative adhesin
MHYSRTGIVAVLVAVEIFIAGAILWSLRGGGLGVHAAGFYRVDQAGRTFDPIDAGAAPHVVIDDPDSGVGVTVSDDGKVHVADASAVHGWVWSHGTRPSLQFTRTSDGVSIRRPPGTGSHFALFGFDREHIDVAVPAGSVLEIQRCSGADVTGLTGSIRVHSVDGHIAATNVHAAALTLRSDDGSLRLNDVNVPAIDATTADGSIRAIAMEVGGGTLQTNDGSITLELQNSNLTVRARTDDGSLRFNGRRAVSDNDASSGDFPVGRGGGLLAVSTRDGSIHITTNGAQ